MKKLLMIFFVVAFILTGCIQQTAIITNIEVPSEISDKLIGTAWQEAYFNVLRERYPSDSERIGLTARHIQLYDLDFDGIPEMLISYLGASNSVIFHGYSYQNGEVLDIQIPEDEMPIGLSLFKNKENGKLIWLADGMFKTGPTSRYYVSELMDFTDFLNVRKEKFFMYDEELIPNEENPSDDKAIGAVYNYYLPDGTSVELSFGEIEEKQNEIFDKYKKIDVQNFFSFVDVFLKNGETLLSSESLDHDLLISFFNEWVV